MSESTPETKRNFCFEQIAEWEASSKSQKDFCALKQINAAQFSYWRKKYRDKRPDSNVKVAAQKRWVALTPAVSEGSNSSAIHIEIAGRCKIAIPMTLSTSQLESIFTLMGLHHVCKS